MNQLASGTSIAYPFHAKYVSGDTVILRSKLSGRSAVALLIALNIGCSSWSLSRSKARELILQNQKERYEDECDMSFLESPGIKNPEQRALGRKLGKAICSYSVEVNGISITTDSVRDVIFTETKIYDSRKVAELAIYAGELFERLAQLPIQAIPDTSLCHDTNPKCSQYHFSVFDPTSKNEFLLGGTIRGIHSISQSQKELWACGCYGSVFKESVLKEAGKRKLSVDDVWSNIPGGLARHRSPTEKSRFAASARRVAQFQLFDDGWRVVEISASR